MWTTRFNSGEAKIALPNDYYNGAQKHAGKTAGTFPVGDSLAILKGKYFVNEEGQPTDLPSNKFTHHDNQAEMHVAA